MTKLLPCPFCGSTPEAVRIGNDKTKSRSILITCPSCRVQRTTSGIRFDLDKLDEMAAEQWNVRAEEHQDVPALLDEIERLRAWQREAAELLEKLNTWLCENRDVIGLNDEDTVDCILDILDERESIGRVSVPEVQR